MKHLLLSLALVAALVFRVSAQDPEAPDTVKIIENAAKVLISRAADSTRIDVESEDEYGKDLFSYTVTVEDSPDSDSDASLDFEIPFGIGKDKSEPKPHSRIHTSLLLLGHIYLGQRFNYFNKGNIKNSIEGGFRHLIGLRWSRGAYSTSFSVGLGFGASRYHAQDGFMFSRIGSNLVLLPVEDGYSVKATELNVFNFQVPLLFTLPIGSEVKFTLGAIGCLNTYARAHTEISNGLTKIKTVYKGLQQRFFTTEVMCSLGVCDIIGVYASWSPMTLFQSPYGPQLKSWGIGVTANF